MTSLIGNRTEVYNQQFSCMGPLVFPVTLDFSVNTSLEVDFTSLVQRNVVDFISSVFVNIIGLNEAMTIRCNATQQTITVPENAQGYFPLMLSDGPVITFTVANVIATPIVVQFSNIPFVPLIDKPAGGSTGASDVNIIEVGGVTVPSGELPVISSGPTINEFTITLTGGDDEIIAAGDAAHYFILQNNTGAPITVNIAGGDATTTGAIIEDGGSIELINGCANAINVSGTMGQDVTAFAG